MGDTGGEAVRGGGTARVTYREGVFCALDRFTQYRPASAPTATAAVSPIFPCSLCTGPRAQEPPV